MNIEKQRIAIAKACGWKRGTKSEASFQDPSKQIVSESWIDPKGITQRKLPDYLNSLDAMVEAERVLNDPRKLIYIQELQSIICGKSSPSHDWVNSLLPSSKLAVFAKAAHRAEAFLRALNFWEAE